MIFVFGSNELGIHKRGAAKTAVEEYGARLGQGFGPQGNSFGIPTCSKPAYGGHEISVGKLDYYIACFKTYARYNGGEMFMVTRIGCGLAGWKNEEVAGLFVNAPDNCYFDEKWKMYLPNKKFWGTY